jgi:hypothetical protein
LHHLDSILAATTTIDNEGGFSNFRLSPDRRLFSNEVNFSWPTGLGGISGRFMSERGEVRVLPVEPLGCFGLASVEGFVDHTEFMVLTLQ